MFRLRIFPTVQIALLSVAAMAQQPIGSVGVQNATVSGELEVTNGRAMLVGSTSITAKDHTAEITLTRGGKVRVCSTSELHLSAGKAAPDSQPLMLALDRGAIELQMAATASDFVLTPDLRFAAANSGPLDLRLRVTRNGDTCVENRGVHAPTIHIADQFGDASYDLHAGQHVLFEHGSLKEVVDSETSPCGCPPDPATLSIADAALAPTDTTATAAKQTEADSEAQHPFPAAVSQGLAPPTPEPPASQPGEIHQQVAATLSYGANAGPDSTAPAPSSTPAASAAATSSTPNTAAASPTAIAHPQSGVQPVSPPPAVTSEVPPPTTSSSSDDLVHRIGHFFKRLFGKA